MLAKFGGEAKAKSTRSCRRLVSRLGAVIRLPTHNNAINYERHLKSWLLKLLRTASLL